MALTTNALVYLLSQHPRGATARELYGNDIESQIPPKTVIALLRASQFVEEGPSKEQHGGINTIKFSLKKYLPGSENDQALKADIQSGKNDLKEKR